MGTRRWQMSVAYLAVGLLGVCVAWEAVASATEAPKPSDITSSTDQLIRLFEGRVTQYPHVVRFRNRLVRAYIQKARENGDATYFTRAETLLTKSLEQEPDNGEAFSLQAWIALFKHEFNQAAGWAEKARVRRPRESWNYGVLSDAYLEMGNYAKATAYAQQMVDLRPDQGSYSRAAHLRSLHGDPAGAIELWGVAIQAGAHYGENAAWCQTELGDEYFNQGQLRQAEASYTAALDSFSGYHRGLAGLAKVREAQQRWSEAADFHHKAIDVVPYPHYVSALGDVYREMGQPEKADQQYRLVEHIARLDRLNQVLYNRDLALFYADHDTNLEEALHLAQKELELRTDIYTYDILAWALYRNRRYTDAQEAVKKALRLGTKDARILFHAGMISSALGHRKKAKTYLGEALAINPYFHPVHRKTAKEVMESPK